VKLNLLSPGSDAEFLIRARPERLGFVGDGERADSLDDTYHPFAAAHGAPVASLSLHPSEGQIVREALAVERERLTAEFELATPEVVVTLGNAALRVLRALVQVLDGEGIQRLAADDRYGAPRRVRVTGRTASWVPLAHPAAPRAYQLAHAAWVERRGRAPTMSAHRRERNGVVRRTGGTPE